MDPESNWAKILDPDPNSMYSICIHYTGSVTWVVVDIIASSVLDLTLFSCVMHCMNKCQCVWQYLFSGTVKLWLSLARICCGCLLHVCVVNLWLSLTRTLCVVVVSDTDVLWLSLAQSVELWLSLVQLGCGCLWHGCVVIVSGMVMLWLPLAQLCWGFLLHGCVGVDSGTVVFWLSLARLCCGCLWHGCVGVDSGKVVLGLTQARLCWVVSGSFVF